jgi:hypothetical protein
MKTISWPVLIVMLMITIACGNTHTGLSTTTGSQHSLFPWMHGDWEMRYDSTTMIYESWKQEQDMLSGSGYVVAGKDTVVRELMQIRRMGNSWVFIAKVNKHDPVLFTSRELPSDSALLFENTEHDYPQQVSYSTMENVLYASVGGTEKGKAKQEHYMYTKRIR